MLLRRCLYLFAVALISVAGAPCCRPAPPITPPEGQHSAPAVPSAVAKPEAPEPEPAALLALPPPPLLSPAGHALILDFETGGRSGYDPRPEWPGGSSGFTIGVGYDCGYFSKAAIGEDWSGLPKATLTRLQASSGETGERARASVKESRDILVAWSVATGVFDRVDVSRTWSQCVKAFPGFDELRPNCQAALVSLVFNRGASMVGNNRIEMRAIRDLTAKRDYDGIAGELRAMVRVWRGTDIYEGMYRRRYAEAQLVMTP